MGKAFAASTSVRIVIHDTDCTSIYSHHFPNPEHVSENEYSFEVPLLVSVIIPESYYLLLKIIAIIPGLTCAS